jgi:hypothetical protein
MVYLTHMTSIFNFLFTIMFYVKKRTKLDLTYICFYFLKNQHNFATKNTILLLIC